jgi:hypothetical protein
MGAAVVRASGEASAGIAGLTVEVCRPEAAPGTAEVENAIEDSLEEVAFASEGIVADSHAAGTHLAAVEEHTEGTGRAHRPAAASCIAGPWLKILRVGAITGSRYESVTLRGSGAWM